MNREVRPPQAEPTSSELKEAKEAYYSLLQGDLVEEHMSQTVGSLNFAIENRLELNEGEKKPRKEAPNAHLNPQMYETGLRVLSTIQADAVVKKDIQSEELAEVTEQLALRRDILRKLLKNEEDEQASKEDSSLPQFSEGFTDAYKAFVYAKATLVTGTIASISAAVTENATDSTALGYIAFAAVSSPLIGVGIWDMKTHHWKRAEKEEERVRKKIEPIFEAKIAEANERTRIEKVLETSSSTPVKKRRRVQIFGKYRG